MRERLDFTFGPVQEFVAQARRTRDLWAGSYLLAYLAGAAIHSISKDVKIVFPDISNDSIIKAMDEGVKGGSPLVGTLPNRFCAEGQDLATAAVKATGALKDAWIRVTDSVWDFIEDKAGEMITPYLQHIWERQMESQWVINWVVSSRPSALEIRKNLRDFNANEEPGEKCTVCGKREVLTPESGMGRKKVADFWSKLAGKINHNNGLQINPDGSERLCSICTIKRLYPLVSDKALGVGWQVNTCYPSTNFVAVIPFLGRLLKKAQEDKDTEAALKSFVESAQKSEVPLTEDGMQIPFLRSLVDGRTPAYIKKALRLDGSVWYESFLYREINTSNSLIKNPRQLLINLQNLFETAKIGKPSPFFCVLVMDGDHMGRLLSDARDRGKEQWVSACLTRFTGKVKEFSEATGFTGRLVYSGGDDVLALIPVEQAIRSASELRKCYVDVFRDGGNNVFTISAAMIFAHYNMPLQAVVAEAHQLLDDFAKAGMGRDAFAVRVWKQSGPALTFAKKWSDGKDWVDELYRLVDEVDKGGYSSRFLYKLPEVMDFIQWGDEASLFSADARVKLLATEYMRERSPDKKCTTEEAEEKVRRLLELATWEQCLNGSLKKLSWKVTPDGPMLVRFLSDSKGGGQR
jgi:CRISPR-associated protein Cmr2